MVYSADTPASGSRTCNTWWDKVPENSSLSVSFMGWTGKWHDSGIGTSYAGSQRIDIMRYKYVSTFFVLYTGLCNAFTIFIPISGERMEFYEDVKFCIISYYGNCIRVSGQSSIAENVFENIIKTSILLCAVMRAQNPGYEKEYLACQKAMQVSRDSPICCKI